MVFKLSFSWEFFWKIKSSSKFYCWVCFSKFSMRSKKERFAFDILDSIKEKNFKISLPKEKMKPKIFRFNIFFFQMKFSEKIRKRMKKRFFRVNWTFHSEFALVQQYSLGLFFAWKGLKILSPFKSDNFKNKIIHKEISLFFLMKKFTRNS